MESTGRSRLLVRLEGIGYAATTLFVVARSDPRGRLPLMSAFGVRSLAWSVLLILLGLAATQGEEPKDPRKTPEQLAAETGEDKIKPLPLTPIPDDPPPHEGAMIELPHFVEP